MRNRSLIIDSMQGKLLANVANTTSANATNLVAGNTTKTLVVPQGSSSTTAKVATNVGGGNYFPMATTITTVSASVLIAPTSPIRINIKKGTSYATSTIQTSITIPTGSKTGSSVMIISLNPNTDFVYYDVTQVGSPQSGVGLSVTYTYNTGY